jgi:hypothetical protein
VTDIQRIKEIARQPSCLRIRLSGQHRQQRDIVGHIEERDQVGCLKNEADHIAPQRAQITYFPAIVINALVANRHLARRRLDHSPKAFEQRTLA